jgi:hypothetical protein
MRILCRVFAACSVLAVAVCAVAVMQEEAFTAGHILRHHRDASFVSPSVTKGKVKAPPTRLAFVDPSSKVGYTRALQRAAFTHVAPCWFEVVAGPHDSDVQVRGADRVDATWAQQAASTGVKLVPRFVVSVAAMAPVFDDAGSATRIAEVIGRAAAGTTVSGERQLANSVGGVVLDWNWDGRGRRHVARTASSGSSSTCASSSWSSSISTASRSWSASPRRPHR